MASRPAQPSSLSRLTSLIGGGQDIGLGIGIIAVISILIIPLPPLLLDLFLTLSISISVMILMTVLLVEKPLQISAFPTILLIATMLRLGLNIASTRLILAHGHEGPHAAGGVIAGAGSFLMGGDTLIGLTIFAILMVINFMVITKGAGRIAEVAARFSLDSMPGKQMAIDADLSAGMIDEATARERRGELEAESAFFGAMDGASKFVRGDAVAGLIITAVNIGVGLIVGMVTYDVDFATAFHTYTLLTVGDGLVSQVPALIVSTAAGLLVSKAGVRGNTEAAVVGQLSAHPKAIGLAGGFVGVLALLPGLPFLPFALIGGGLGFAAWKLTQIKEARALDEAAEAAQQQQAPARTAEEAIADTLKIDPVRIELGYGLLALVNGPDSVPRLDEQIKALRKQMAVDYGFVLPTVRLLDNMALDANDYVLLVKETEVARGNLRTDRLMVIASPQEALGLAGEETREPAFGLPALWIAPQLREEAAIRGLTVVDAATVITTHMTEVLRDNLSDLFSYIDTQKLLGDLPEDAKKLVADLVPSRISVSAIQRVLQNLLAENVSIRDLITILEGIAEAVGYTSNISLITEHVRARLARQISTANTRNGTIALLQLSPDWEAKFGAAIVGQGDDRHLAMEPSEIQAFIATIRDAFDRWGAAGELPCLLTSALARPFVRSILERVRPSTVVLSQLEIHPRARVRVLGAL